MHKVIILVSGTGSNMINILESRSKLAIEVVKVFSDRHCSAVETAQKDYGVFTEVLERQVLSAEQISDEINKQALDMNVDLIVLAGFLSILKGNILVLWEGRIINIHPSLLPLYGGAGMYGLRVHEAVLRNQDKISGCTVHLVTPKIDKGKILVQKKVEVSTHDTSQSLAQKVLQQEHVAMLEAICLLLKKT